MNNLSNLQPSEIWHYFGQITQIPRASGKEQKIIKYLLNFAKENNLEAKKDALGNVLIRKHASKGKEKCKIVILQSHLDMVCEKNSDSKHNFDKDPIQTWIDGEWVKAKGTTLGGDDGIGIAASMAILASDKIEHGPLECLFTVDEETGMTGAFGLEPDFMNGQTLINLDSEDEGELFIGCAGGKDTSIELEYQKEPFPAGFYSCKIAISGLNGGHSGDDIEKGFGNSNKILNRFLYQLSTKVDFRLAEFNGGNLRNAIPREAYAIICLPSSAKELVRIELNIYSSVIKAEYAVTEKNLQLDLSTCDSPAFLMDKISQDKLIGSLYACPHGVMAMSHTLKGLVETSTNLASVKFKDENIIVIGTSQRSSVNSALNDISCMVANVFKLIGAKINHSDGYPGWNPKLDSEILKITETAYNKLFGRQPIVRAIHAGLECGLFLTKYPNMDMVSFGPTIKGAHSPDERLNIQTVQKFWDLLIEVLKNID
jgi:dipeptidase D